MAMLNHNLGNIAGAAGAGARFLRQVDEDVSSVLLGVGFVTCVTAVTAVAFPPAACVLSYPVYLGVLAGAFVGGVGTMWAAVWVAGDRDRRRATGRVILCASLVPMVVAVGLSGNAEILLRAIA